jgi:DNA polymerase V
MTGLVDGNNFYVSCERIFDLSLAGRPVVVLSNNDGCVISRSNEAKALGVAMGAPFFQIEAMAKRQGIVVKSSNYELYGDISARMVAVLRELALEVEQYSIDEAFIGIALPAGSSYREFGEEVRRRVLRWVGIPCGIGFAPTKTLAKIANHIGKKLPEGVFVMPADPGQVLGTLPVGEVWGVGKKLTERLQRVGVKTAGQLAAMDESLIRSQFSVVLARTAMELRGIPAVADINIEAPPDSVTCSRSFGRPVVEFDEIAESVAHYTAQAAEKLRTGGQVASGANVYLQYRPEHEGAGLAGGFTESTVSFSPPTDETAAMLRSIMPRLRGIFIAGRRYKKTGVVLWGLESAAFRQPDLFDTAAAPGKGVSAAADEINRKFGRGTIFTLAEGVARPWSMRRTRLSPSYTTRWDQLPMVK